MRTAWKTEPLGEVCEFQRGLTYAKADEVDVSDTVVLRATNISLATNLLDFAELRYISDSVQVPASKRVRRESLLVCTASGSRSHLGKVAFIDDDYGHAFGGFMGMLTARNGVLPRYLFHLMTSPAYKEFLHGLTGGTSINNLTFTVLKEFSVPHPALPEQRRIVGILDEAFAAIAIAKANAERNLHNARALFDSHLRAVFTGGTEAWIERPLSSLASFRNGINYTRDSRGECIRVVGVKDFKSHFAVPMDDLATARLNGTLGEVDALRSGDILCVRSNGNIELIGRCMLTGEVAGRIAHSGFTIRIRTTSTDVLPAFLCHFMRSPDTRLRLTEGGTGTSIKSLNQEMLSTLPIPVPPRRAQLKVVQRLEQVAAATQRLESACERKLAALDALKSSLLHQAFSGQL